MLEHSPAGTTTIRPGKPEGRVRIRVSAGPDEPQDKEGAGGHRVVSESGRGEGSSAGGPSKGRIQAVQVSKFDRAFD